MKTFEQLWVETGCQYGREELENVKFGWELRNAEVEELKEHIVQLEEELKFWRQGKLPE